MLRIHELLLLTGLCSTIGLAVSFDITQFNTRCIMFYDRMHASQYSVNSSLRCRDLAEQECVVESTPSSREQLVIMRLTRALIQRQVITKPQFAQLYQECSGYQNWKVWLRCLGHTEIIYSEGLDLAQQLEDVLPFT